MLVRLYHSIERCCDNVLGICTAPPNSRQSLPTIIKCLDLALEAILNRLLENFTDGQNLLQGALLLVVFCTIGVRRVSQAF